MTALSKQEMQQLMAIGTKKCLVCFKNTGKIRNDTIYWHIDRDNGDIWSFCNRCERGYSIYDYTRRAGLSLSEFLKQDFVFKEASPNEVQKIEWPKSFIPLFDKRANPGIEYLKSRGLEICDSLFYDLAREGIVFPYYFDTVFCGAQIRLIKPWRDQEGVERKIDTLPGSRVGLLVFNWNQKPLPPHIKGVIITEGAFNALSIQQALNEIYGGFFKNPFKCIALSGSGVSGHHIEIISQLKEQGLKTIAAPDFDEAGLKMLEKLNKHQAITHYMLTGDDRRDWNDIAQTMSKKEFAKWVLGNIKHV